MKQNTNRLATFQADFPASIVVFFVALPLCLGIALASGAPLISGIIAGIIGGIVVGASSGSKHGVSGPAAGLAVIVLTAIQDLGAFDIFLVAVILAGFFQLALGFLKAGAIAYYFPSSVISGMLSGIGIIIFLKQIPHAFGYDKDPEGDFSFVQQDGETTFSELFKSLDYISYGAIIIAVISILILILWEHPAFKNNKILSKIPGSLVAVVSGVLLHLSFRSQSDLALNASQLVALPVATNLTELSAFITFPDFSALRNPEVYKVAIVIAIVASLETLLCVEATDKLDPKKRITPSNQELKAQGFGNILAGFLGGIPITQVIVRSSANIGAGNKTKAAAVLHGILLLISVVALPMIMNLIPLATLAAILLLVGYKLAKPALFINAYRKGFNHFTPFLVTVLGVVLTDLLTGVSLGLAVAVIALLKENFQMPFEIHPSTGSENSEIKILLAQQVTFLNKASILNFLKDIKDGSKILIDASSSLFVHNDVVEIIDDFVISAPSRNIDVRILGLEHAQKGHPTGGIKLTL